MSGLAGVARRATAGSGRSRRNMYLADFDTEATDQATGSLPLTGGIFKNAAFEILKQEERLMTSGEITKLAMERKLLRCMGKTPENTMASALYTEVRKKASTTVFIKPKEGLFGLKAWLNEPWLLNWLAQEGIDVADVHDPGGGVEPVSKKIRTSYNGAASRAAAGGAGSGGGYFSHRTSSNGVPPLLRSSSAGLGPASLGSAAALNGPHRASMSGYAQGHGPGGGGGRGPYINPAAVAAAATSGGMSRPMYTGGRGGGGGCEYANGVAAGGAASTSDALSSLQLLVDAADEIEGGPEDAPPSNSRPPPVRRRSDGVLRQTSFRRQRQGISRETSLPSMIARVRVRDDFEDEQEDGEDAAADEYGEQGEEEEPYDDEAAVAAALHHRDAVRMLQQRQHSSNKLYHHHAAAAAAVAQLQEQQEELEQQPAFRQRALQQQPQQQPMLLPPLHQHLHHHHQHPRPYPHQRHQGVGAAEEGSEEDDGEPHDGCEPEGRALEADGREPGAAGARWMSAEVEDLRHYHQNSGVHRGGRGGRGGGRTGGPIDGAAVASGRARGGRGRGTAFDSGRRAVRSEEAEVEEDGQMDEDVNEGEAGSGEDAEEVGPAAAAAPRRCVLPPRPGADRRGGGGAASGAGAGRLRQAAGTSTGRRHPDVGGLPQHVHMHMTGTQSFPGQLPVPLMGMPVGLPPGALGQGPHPHAPLHLLQRMPPGAAAAGLPHNAVAMLGGGGGGGMVLSDQVLGQLRAAATMGYGTVPGLGLPPLPGLIPPQALLGMGLSPGLVGLDMGALLGEPAAGLAAATAAAQTAAGGGAGAAGARSHPLPPALAQIATVLGRSPGLSATLVAAQGRIAELSGVSPEATAAATEHGEDGKSTMGLLKAEAARDGRKARRDAKMDGDAPMRGGDTRVGITSAGKGDGALKRAGGPADATISQLAAAATGATPAGAKDEVVAGEPDSGPTLKGPSEGGVGMATEDPQPIKQQHQQPALGEAPNRGPTSLSPPGGPAGAAAVALNDAMNSPDSQVAGCADRASPVTDDPSGRGGGGGPTDRRTLAGERIASNDSAAAAAAWPCNSGGAAGAAAAPPASALGTGAVSSPGEGKGPASGAGAWAQLALLQQQHLKLLLPVERARPGDVPDPQAINRIHHQVLEMESRMGALHPETGRAYVLLARVLEHKGTCWSLAMAERALMRAWTIVGVVSSSSSSNNSKSSSRRTSDAGALGPGGASAVAGVAEAAAAEAGAGATPGEMLCELPDSFHTFHYLLEQIRMKQSYLQAQQEQQLLALLQMVAMVGAPAAAAVAAAAAARGDVTVVGGIGGAAAASASAALGGLMMGGAPLPPGACDEAGYGAPAGSGGAV